MKTAKQAATALLIFISGSAFSVESLIVCEGKSRSANQPDSGEPERRTFLIEKSGGKVTSVKTDYGVFKAERVDVRDADKTDPVFRFLLAEPDKLILRTEITAEKRNNDIVILNTGAYTVRFSGYEVDGVCKVTEKLF